MDLDATGGMRFRPTGVESADSPRRSALRDWLGRVWARPDPELIDAGQRGEWMIAGLRLLIVVIILYFPLRLYFQDPGRAGQQAVLWLAVAALAEALVVYSAVMRSWGRGWIGFFSGIVDVSLVTLSLFIFLRLGKPLQVTNDLLIFPVYLIAIGATSLRYDWRVCILAGSSAVAQYLTLVWYTVWLWDLDNAAVAPLLAAEFSWGQQLGRAALLVMATFLATTVVVRAKEQRSLSNRDRLTGLANRGFFDESMARIGAIASRSGDPVALAMMDVDHFKKFNDTYGHQAGDRALITVARVLADSFRNTDLVARYGGEEFVGLFPGMGVSDAVQRLDRLRREVEAAGIHLDSGKVVHVTMSLGVAVWPKDGMTLADTLELADGRLYKAKQSGRNRVVGDADLRVAQAQPAPARRATDRQPPQQPVPSPQPVRPMPGPTQPGTAQARPAQSAPQGPRPLGPRPVPAPTPQTTQPQTTRPQPTAPQPAQPQTTQPAQAPQSPPPVPPSPPGAPTGHD